MVFIQIENFLLFLINFKILFISFISYMSRDNWFAQVVAICWQSATTPSFFVEMKNELDLFYDLTFKDYKRVPSKSSILKVLSIVKKLRDILEVYENIFINLIISNYQSHQFYIYDQFYH